MTVGGRETPAEGKRLPSCLPREGPVQCLRLRLCPPAASHFSLSGEAARSPVAPGWTVGGAALLRSPQVPRCWPSGSPSLAPRPPAWGSGNSVFKTSGCLQCPGGASGGVGGKLPCLGGPCCPSLGAGAVGFLLWGGGSPCLAPGLRDPLFGFSRNSLGPWPAGGDVCGVSWPSLPSPPLCVNEICLTTAVSHGVS